MKRKHAAAISVLLAGAVSASAFAVTRDPTPAGGAVSGEASNALLAQRAAELDAFEAMLDEQTAQEQVLASSDQSAASGGSWADDDDGYDDEDREDADHDDDEGDERDDD